jgi:peptide/histidine transporter 3/4
MKVYKYIWTHKQPVRRSAFTYGEPPPSRFDLAKERYGGPFTTDDVENLKTSWNVFSVIVFVMSTFAIQDSSSIPLQWYDTSNLTSPLKVLYYNLETYNVSFFTICICILIYQLILLPFFSRCIPSMLKLMGIGIVVALVKNLILVATPTLIDNSNSTLNIANVVCYRNHANYQDIEFNSSSTLNIANVVCFCNYQDIEFNCTTCTLTFIFVCQMLAGLSFFLVFIIGTDFIIAQTPHNLQKSMLGSWLVINNVYSFMTYIFNLLWWCHEPYYAIKSVTIIIYIVLYFLMARRYSYRQRNELSDINERHIIEVYTERQLLQRSQNDESERQFDTSYVCQTIQ